MYLTSESYGGHYLPTLAKVIVDKNTAGLDPKLNFGGFAVGNPYTDVYSGSPAMLDTMWGHQLVPYPLWSQYVSAGCQNDSLSNAAAIKCFALENELYNAMGELNPYALDYDICVSSSSSEKAPRRSSSRPQRLWLLHAQLASRGAESEVQEKDHRSLVETTKMKDSYQPCADDFATSWANFANVKAALHVKTDITWEECSSTTRYNYSDSAVSMVPIYKNVLIPSNISILVFSGDDDSICATIGTQSWIWSMGFQPLNMWEPWYDVATKEPFGFLTRFSGTQFSFLTVHKAGHEVPMTQPKAGLQVWEQFITGKLTG
jgi:carboxypeptidase C (cathepsin A)